LNKSEPSRRAHLSETRALSSLASTRTPQKHAGLPASRRLPNRRAAISAALVVFLMVTAWVTVPASSDNSGMKRGQAASSSELVAPARVPSVRPLPTPTREARTIDSVATAKVAVDAAEPSRGTATPNTSTSVSGGTSTTRGPRAWHSPARPTPRAGRLFRSDF
jgi:hypothetical protein